MQHSILSVLFQGQDFIRSDILLLKYFTYVLPHSINFYDSVFKTIQHNNIFRLVESLISNKESLIIFFELIQSLILASRNSSMKKVRKFLFLV